MNKLLNSMEMSKSSFKFGLAKRANSYCLIAGVSWVFLCKLVIPTDSGCGSISRVVESTFTELGESRL